MTSVLAPVIFALFAMIAGSVGMWNIGNANIGTGCIDFLAAVVAMVIVLLPLVASDWDRAYKEHQASQECNMIAAARQKARQEDAEFERDYHSVMAMLKAIVDNNSGAVDADTRDRAQENKLYLAEVHRSSVADLNAEFAHLFPLHDNILLSGYEADEAQRLLDSLGGDDSE